MRDVPSEFVTRVARAPFPQLARSHNSRRFSPLELRLIKRSRLSHAFDNTRENFSPKYESGRVTLVKSGRHVIATSRGEDRSENEENFSTTSASSHESDRDYFFKSDAPRSVETDANFCARARTHTQIHATHVQ